MSTDCHHGQQKNVCHRCELEARVAELEANHQMLYTECMTARIDARESRQRVAKLEEAVREALPCFGEMLVTSVAEHEHVRRALRAANRLRRVFEGQGGDG